MQSEFLLGQHEALLQQLVDGQTQIFTRLGTIEATLAERRGERRYRAWMSGVVGAFLMAVLEPAARLLFGKHA